MHLEQPVLKGFNFKGGIRLIPELVALLLALSLYTASFIAENVRSGILAINKGQIEAANAVGLQRIPILRLISYTSSNACHYTASNKSILKSYKKFIS